MDLSTVMQQMRNSPFSFGASKRSPLLVVTWDRTHLYYLVIVRRGEECLASTWGHLTRAESGSPLDQLAAHCAEQQIAARRLLLALPRPELEMLKVEVPSAGADEIAGLIQVEVDQQLGDGDESLVVDYSLLAANRPGWHSQSPGASAGGNADAVEGTMEAASAMQGAIAFSLDRATLERWETEAAKHRWQLAGITSRQIVPLRQLGKHGQLPRGFSVLIVLYESEIELTFLRGSDAIFLRTFRISSHALDALTDQIQTEVQRSLSMMALQGEAVWPELLVLDRGDAEGLVYGDLDPLSGVTQTAADQETEIHESPVGQQPQLLGLGELCETLEAKLVSLRIEGSTSIPREGTVAAAGIDAPEPVLIAAALDLAADSLAIDLLDPKRPMVPPSPVRRWVTIGSVGLASLGLGGYLLHGDVRDLRVQVEEKRADVTAAEKSANKLQERADEARLVRQWLADQVDWLGLLERLTSQFPSGSSANVRRLSSGVQENRAFFSLSIQVSDPEQVAKLEDRLREAGFSITSKQISEQGGNPEYPWQFEATIAAAVASLEELEETEEFENPAPPDDLSPDAGVNP